MKTVFVIFSQDEMTWMKIIGSFADRCDRGRERAQI